MSRSIVDYQRCTENIPHALDDRLQGIAWFEVSARIKESAIHDLLVVKFQVCFPAFQSLKQEATWN